MYNTLVKLYAKNHDKAQIHRAVEKGWISEDEYRQIVGEDDLDHTLLGVLGGEQAPTEA